MEDDSGKTPAVPKRTLNIMMNALSSGVVPRRGLEFIAVGRKAETATFVRDMEDTAEGGGAFRFISGRFGNGKSFLTQMIRTNAMDKGFVVMDADLADSRRLTGSKKEGLNTYKELIKNMAVRTRPDGGAIESVLQEWIDAATEEATKKLGKKPDDDAVELILKESVADLGGLQNSRDFAKALLSYWKDLSESKDDIPALRWLKGEIELKRDSRKLLGVDSTIGDDNWYGFVKLWARFAVNIGYKGLIVFLDEAVVLYKLQNKVARNNNYERILSIFNDIMQGKSSHLSVYMCGTPEFIEDPNRGLYSYEALRSRLVGGRYENGYDNFLGPVIRLRPLTNEEIYVLLRTIRNLHEQKYEYASKVTDENLKEYLAAILSSVSASMLTPREITRDLISLLDVLKQNPDAKFEDLVTGRTLEPDRNPDDDLIDDLEI